MSQNLGVEQRTGPRYVAQLPIRAEWSDGASGKQVVVEGITQNVGPGGTLVELEILPAVGSHVRLRVLDPKQSRLEITAEVLRLERNPAQPLAAFQLLDPTDEWCKNVWEPAATPVKPLVRRRKPVKLDDDDSADADLF